jgi:HK97 gp10 family phage protein
MKIDFNTNDFTYSVMEEISKIPEVLEAESKKIMQKAAKIVKKNVENNLPKSDLNATATNYDGTPYVHMRNDVKTSVKDDKKGTIFAIIRGGKYTGYKWHMLNNGTSSMRANHFVDKALKQSEAEIEAMVDEMISKAVQ